MSKQVTKADLVNYVSQKTNLTLLETEACIESFLISIIQALKNGGQIEIRGFGRFKTLTKKAHLGRNPKTGTPLDIPQRTRPSFKFSKEAVKSFRGE